MSARLIAEFQAFHKENPHVYEKLIEIALEIVAVKKRYGIAALFERLRWINDFETTGDQFKLNNNYRAFYARMLRKETPEFEELFSVRKSVADAVR